MQTQSYEEKKIILEESNTWAYYQGTKYSVDQLDDEEYILVSDNSETDFEYDDSTKKYFRIVTNKLEIDYGIKIYPSVIFQNHEYTVLGWNLESDRIVLLSNQKIKGYECKIYERSYFSVRVPLNDPALIIVKNEGRAFDLPLRNEVVRSSDELESEESVECPISDSPLDDLQNKLVSAVIKYVDQKDAEKVTSNIHEIFNNFKAATPVVKVAIKKENIGRNKRNRQGHRFCKRNGALYLGKVAKNNKRTRKNTTKKDQTVG